MSFGKFLISVGIAILWAGFLMSIFGTWYILFWILTFLLILGKMGAMVSLISQTYNDLYLVEKDPEKYSLSVYEYIDNLRKVMHIKPLAIPYFELIQSSFNSKYKRNIVSFGMVSSLIYAFAFLSLNLYVVAGFLFVSSIVTPLLKAAMLDRMNTYAHNEVVEIVNDFNKKYTNNSSE